MKKKRNYYKKRSPLETLPGTKVVDITDMRFGRLVAKRYVGKQRWECVCEPEHGGCGKKVHVFGTALRAGHTRSCGCLRRNSPRNKRKGNRKHGLSHTPEYSAWNQLWQRCGNPKHPQYADYGGRGITVANEWRSFANFYAAMGKRPSARHSLGRVDNDGPYSPSNCRWELAREQALKTRRATAVRIGDETRTLTEWCEFYDISYSAVRSRLSRGWPLLRALMQPSDDVAPQLTTDDIVAAIAEGIHRLPSPRERRWLTQLLAMLAAQIPEDNR